VDPQRDPEAGTGEPHHDHGDSGKYPVRTPENAGTWERVADPHEPYGHGHDGAPLTKQEYDERWTRPNGAPRYPFNEGARSGSRVTYTDTGAFVERFGSRLDRIGDPGGTYLAVMENGVPATFEQRSLPPTSLNNSYHQYTFADNAVELMQRDGINIEVSRIAPAFGREGGGLQVLVYGDAGRGESIVLSVDQMLERGYLR
jgi:hypothetical protein